MADNKQEELLDLLADKSASTADAKKCPHCNEPISIGVMVPDAQKLSFRLDLQSEWCGAATFGHCLVDLDKILKGSAKSLGTQVEVYIESVEQEPNRLQANLIVMAVIGKTKKKGR